MHLYFTRLMLANLSVYFRLSNDLSSDILNLIKLCIIEMPFHLNTSQK